MDISAIVMTMPLAKLPIWCQRPRIERSMCETPEVGRLLGEREGEGLRDLLLDFPPANLGRVEFHVRQHVSDGLREAVVTGLQDLEGAHLGAARRIHDE